jgi:phosphoribosylglycinamide formyltransferase-1
MTLSVITKDVSRKGAKTQKMALTALQLSLSTERRAKLVAICQAFPKVAVEVAGDQHIAFRANKRIFAYYLFDHHGDGMIAFCCKSNLSEQRRQVRNDPDNFFVPAYLGSKGWIAMRLDLDEVDWEVVTEFARTAYLAVVPRKLAALVEP